MNTKDDAVKALALILRAIRRSPDTGQGVRLIKFLAGLYNSYNYPFQLNELRGLDGDLRKACLAYLAYDALGELEVHHLIPGGAKQLNCWFEDCGIKPKDATLEDLPASRGGESILVNAELVSYGSTPGYRSVTLGFEIKQYGAEKSYNLELHIQNKDGVQIKEHIGQVHRFAWREGRGPIDIEPGEQRPAWLTRS